MGNPFDQFDTQASEGSNPFDQFDAPKKQDSALVRGLTQANSARKTFGALTTGDYESAAKLAAERDAYQRANPGTPEGNELMAAWEKGDGVIGGIKGVAGEFAKDWREAPTGIAALQATGKNLSAMGGGIVEQIPNMVMPMAGMLAGGAAGSLAGPVGTVGGAFAGAATGNTAAESAEQVDRAIRGAGINPQDTNAVRSFLEQDAGGVLGKSAIKGGIIGAVDTATMGIGGKMLRAPVSAATDRAIASLGINAADKAAVAAAREQIGARVLADPIYQASQKGAQALTRNATVGALEPVGEFAGEYLGQGVATGDWDTKGAMLEALSSLGQSGITYAGQKIYQSATSPLRGVKADGQAAPQNTPDIPPDVTLITEPTPLQQRIDAMLGLDSSRMDDKGRKQYETDLVAAFNEPIGIRLDADQKEVPFTMGEYLDAQVSANDAVRARAQIPAQSANQQASNRLAQLADEEAQHHAAITQDLVQSASQGGALSQAALTGIQTGATQMPVHPERAAIEQQMLLDEAAQAELAPVERLMRSRTDAQVHSIAQNPSANANMRKAAIADLQRRLTTQAQPTTTAPLQQTATQFNVPNGAGSVAQNKSSNRLTDQQLSDMEAEIESNYRADQQSSMKQAMKAVDEVSKQHNRTGMTFGINRQQASNVPAQNIPTNLVANVQTGIAKGASGIAQRQANAANNFINSVQEQFGLSKEDAGKAWDHFVKNKLVKIDAVGGQYTLTDGRLWDGEVIRRAANNEAQPKPKSKPGRREIDSTKDTLFQAIAKLGGMDTQELTGNGFDPKDITYETAARVSKKTGKLGKKSRLPISFGFNMPLHKKGGMSFDGMLEALKQHGYFPEDATKNDAIDAFRRELGGDAVVTPDAEMRNAEESQAEYEAEMQAEQEANEAIGYDNLNEREQALVDFHAETVYDEDNPIEAFKRGMRRDGATEEEINEQIKQTFGTQETGNSDSAETQAGTSETRNAEGFDYGLQDGQIQEGAEPDWLTGQSNEQAADQFAQQQAVEPSTPTKEQADRERDAVPFSLNQQSQPKPQGVQTGLFTADGRVSSEAKPVAQSAQDKIKSLQEQLKTATPFEKREADLNGQLIELVTKDAEQAISDGTAPAYKTGDSTFAIIHPSAQKDGMIQVTRYNEDGVFGDSQYNDVESAVRDNALWFKPRMSESEATAALDASAKAEEAYRKRRESQPTQDNPVQSNAKSDASLERTKDRNEVRFETPYIGIGGNYSLVGYVWPNKKEEYIDRRGEDRVRTVSDWEAAGAVADARKKIIAARDDATDEVEAAALSALSKQVGRAVTGDMVALNAIARTVKSNSFPSVDSELRNVLRVGANALMERAKDAARQVADVNAQVRPDWIPGNQPPVDVAPAVRKFFSEWGDAAVDAKKEAETPKVVSGKQDDGIRYSKVSDAPAGEELVAIHNLSSENVLHAAAIGGIPVPSIGITKLSSPFTDFGEITLIADKGMIDPENSVPVFDRDAYTARFPEFNYKKVTAKKADAFYERMKSARELGDDGQSFISQIWDAIKNSRVQSPKKVADVFRTYLAPRMLYAKEVLGKEIKVPMIPVKSRVFFGHEKSWIDFVKTNEELRKSDEDAYNKAASNAIKKAVDDFVNRHSDNEVRNVVRSAYKQDIERYIGDDWVNGNYLDWAIQDAKSVGAKRVDSVALSNRVAKIVPQNDPAYLKWVSNEISDLFVAPTITLRGKEVEASLDNIVEAMTIGKTVGAEKTMTFGVGKTSAMLGKRFRSIKEIQDHRNQVVSSSRESEMKKDSEKLLEEYRLKAVEHFTHTDWKGNVDIFAGFDAAMEALAKAGKGALTDGNIASAMRSVGFKNVPSDVINLARQGIVSIREAATDYFEAKPQRSVKLNEFNGAVIPNGTDQEVIDALKESGITEIRTYKRGDEDSRKKSVALLAKKINAQNKNTLFSKADSAQSHPITRTEAESRIKSILGDKLGKVLIDSGIVTFTNKGSEYQGATYKDGSISLNLDALNADNFAGVLQHEGFHSTIRDLVGEQTYTQMMKRLDTMLAMGKGAQWVKDADAAIPSDTKAEHRTEEIAAYSIEQYVNGAKQPNIIKRWVESLLSAIRTAIIQRMPNGKLKLWAIGNLQPQDLANLAIAGLKAKAQGQLQAQGREAMAYSIDGNVESDANYIAAINRGDIESARKMVDAKLAKLGAYWHGTPSGDLRGGTSGLHVGTRQAAMEALEARIGIPADGSGWDGTKEYGKTLLAGRDRVASGQFGKYRDTGYNSDSPRNDFFAKDHKFPTVGNGVSVNPKWKPWIRPVLIVGNMAKRHKTDSAANSSMMKLIKRGEAREGFYYKNDGEDVGSVSAVLPNGDYVRVKLADPITYDDEGNVIPLSLRFNPGNQDVRFSKINQTDTPAFKKWFGSSKVVDADGKPLVVYHGTNADFSVFKTTRSGEFGPAIYLTDNQREAGEYGEAVKGISLAQPSANIMPVYARIENPYTKGVDEFWREFGGSDSDAAGVERAKSAGYDGIIAKRADRYYDNVAHEFVDRGNTLTHYIAFSNTQVKSAIGNNGNFDGTNPDIRYSKAQIIGDSGRPYDQTQRQFFKNVGRDIEKKNLVERTTEYLKNDFWKKMAVGIVDQFRGLRDLGDNGQAYMLARLSKGTAGAFDALLHHGKLSIRDGVYDADTSGGFIDRLGTPLHGELDDFLWYVAANRAEGLSKTDRENLFTPADIAAGKSLAKGQTDFDYTIQTGPQKGTTTRSRMMIYADANRVFNEFQKNAIDMAEQSGLIDGASRKLWESEFYVPFYRVSEEDGEFIGAKMGNALVRQQAFKKLKGGTDKLNSDLLSNTLLNFSHLIEASAKNRAAKASLAAAEKVGAAQRVAPDMASYAASNGSMLPPGTKRTVWFQENGNKVEYKVTDPFVMTAITSLEYAGMNNGIMGAMSKFKHYLTIGVTASPAFKVRNLIRDSLQAIGTSDLSYNPIKNVTEGFKQTKRGNQDYVSALASGGLIRFGTMLEGSESSRVRQLIRSGVKDSTILNSENKWQAFFDKFIEPGIEAYNELGNRSEEINRAALYNQLIKQGKSHAEAALLARDLMDFSMQGSFTSIRMLTQVVPFMNARLQGLYKLGRAAHDDPRKMAIVTGAVAMASIALMLAYDDDDDWKRREDWDRDTYWWFKVGGVEYRIPKPFELGAVASLAERGLELMMNDEMTGERFRKVTSNLILNQLAMNPIPQAFKPIVDLYANKDSFTGRPIESMGMERLDPTERFNSSTSMLARGLSNATMGAMSPVQYDHLARAYFGWLGSFVVGGADMALRSMSNEPTKPALDYYKFATQGMAKEAGTGGSRYLTQLYDQAKELEQAYSTYRHLMKDGRIEEAKQYGEENKDKLMRYKQVEGVKRIESKFNEQIHRVERSDADAETKKASIERIQRQKEIISQRIAPGYQ